MYDSKAKKQIGKSLLLCFVISLAMVAISIGSVDSAEEPDIAEPIAFCFDDRGRMWIAENFNYRTRREHTEEPVSRIQILEDSDGDGVFDKKKTFTDQLTTRLRRRHIFHE